MEAPQFAPLYEPKPRPQLEVIQGGAESGLAERGEEPQLDNWLAGPESFRVEVKQDVSNAEHSWKLNGRDMGLVDWDISDGEGFIDSADAVPETESFRGSEVKVRKAGLKLIAICMHHLNGDIGVINTPADRIIFH